MNSLLGKDEITRALRRMAHEIIESNKGAQDLCLIGIKTRGVPIARRIEHEINSFENAEIPVGEMDITLYRDDIFINEQIPEAKTTDISFDINGKKVVIVDDVLYTGRTVRAAINALMEIGRPKRIQLAVLIDRGHREMPFRADFVGKNVPTAKEETVSVALEETDGLDGVSIDRR